MAKIKKTIALEQDVFDYVSVQRNGSKFVNDLIKKSMIENDEVYQKTKFQKKNDIIERINTILKEEL